MTVEKPKKDLGHLLSSVQAKIIHNIDFIPINYWGFDEPSLELLRKQKHAAVNQKLSKTKQKKLTNMEKQQMAESIGAIPKTISQVFKILANSKLANKKPKRPNVRVIKKNKEGETKENDVSLDPEIANILKRKRVAKRPFVRNAINIGKISDNPDLAEDGTPFKKSRKQKMPPTEEDKAKRREKRKVSKQKSNQTKAERNSKSKADLKLENVKEEITESTPKNDGLSFSKLDFVIKDKKPLTKKEKREKLSGRDYASLQKKVEKRTQYLQKLSEKNPEKAKGLEEKIAWDVMAKRAAGQKVKDNPVLLEKALNRKNKLKEKRKAKWSKRTDKVTKDKEKRQEKRETNIAKRRDVKVKKKLERARKKGRAV